MTNSTSLHQHSHPPESEPVAVIGCESLAPNLRLLTARAPAVAAKIQPGQFVIVRADEYSERIPLTVADWNRSEGTISCVFMQVGTSTYKLGQLKTGNVLNAFVGPLGKPLDLNFTGTAALVGGCYGIGSIYPIARDLKEKGNRVISIIEGRSKFLLYWLDRLQAVSDKVVISTRDRSVEDIVDGPDALKHLVSSGEKIDRVIAIGCTFMMYQMAKATKPLAVKTIVSLNPIMIDGTGMCGACRVFVNGQTKFACVDGPHFDAHQVDWELLLARRKAYLNQETDSAER